jgi:hypothetical protein
MKVIVSHRAKLGCTQDSMDPRQLTTHKFEASPRSDSLDVFSQRHAQVKSRL